METSFTPQQHDLHNELLRFEYEALSKLHNVRCIPFMMSTIRRQAASCIFGLAPHIRDLINRRFDQLQDDPDAEPVSSGYGVLKGFGIFFGVLILLSILGKLFGWGY